MKISKWYRGHESSQNALNNFGVIWLTDDPDYAQDYADNSPDGIVSIVYIDDNKLNPVDVFHNDFDTYFPSSKHIEEFKEEGFNCYYFCAGEDDIQCLALLSKEPVVKVEQYKYTHLTENDLKYIIKETIDSLVNDTDDYKDFVNNILNNINQYLSNFGLSCSINTKYDFSGYYKDCVAVYQYRSVMNNGKMRIALNIPLMMSHELDDYEMKEQIEISMWHEVGHGIVQWIKSIRRKDTQAKTGLFKGKILKDLRYILNNEEDVVEEFGEHFSGYHSYSTLNDFITEYEQIIKA